MATIIRRPTFARDAIVVSIVTLAVVFLIGIAVTYFDHMAWSPVG